mgnify:CR=1 FL=1
MMGGMIQPSTVALVREYMHLVLLPNLPQKQNDLRSGSRKRNAPRVSLHARMRSVSGRIPSF